MATYSYICAWRIPWTESGRLQFMGSENWTWLSMYFGHLMRRVDSLETTLMLGGIGGRRRRGQPRIRCWMASRTQWLWVWVNSVSWWWTGRPGVLWFMGSQRVRHDWETELNWTEHVVLCQHLLDHWKSKGVPEKHLFLLYWLCQSLCGKLWKIWEYQTTWPATWKNWMQVRKQQLELDIEKQTGSRFGKEYVKAVYCHPA